MNLHSKKIFLVLLSKQIILFGAPTKRVKTTENVRQTLIRSIKLKFPCYMGFGVERNSKDENTYHGILNNIRSTEENIAKILCANHDCSTRCHHLKQRQTHKLSTENSVVLDIERHRQSILYQRLAKMMEQDLSFETVRKQIKNFNEEEQRLLLTSGEEIFYRSRYGLCTQIAKKLCIMNPKFGGPRCIFNGREYVKPTTLEDFRGFAVKTLDNVKKRTKNLESSLEYPHNKEGTSKK